MEKPTTTILLKPGEQLSCSSGKAYTIVLRNPLPHFVFDGHSHIQAGACCPLPLLWVQHPFARKHRPGRKFLNFAASFIGSGGKIQKKSTEEIAAKLVDEIRRAFGPDSMLRKNAGGDFFTLSVIMSMDIDFAHIAGFDGSMIYHETDEKVVYYVRSEAFAAETSGEIVDLTGERPNRVWVYQHYIKQYRATRRAALKYPWMLIPMFHYDPRRWLNPAGGDMDFENWHYGPWNYPFELIATLRRAGVFIGFKMYPPLGYQPLDPRLPHLRSFYRRCIDEGIPILTHCSPGGLVTHEAEFYHRIDKINLSIRKVPGDPPLGYNPCTPRGYFYHEYVHPKNWRTVLESGNRDLTLCLAHCGGNEWLDPGIESDWIQEIVRLTKEFDNVYTDVACHNLTDERMRNNVGIFLEAIAGQQEYRHLRDKLIFGVDWYLSMLTGGPEYKEYVDSFHALVTGIDEELWQRMTVVNPARFYGLDKSDKVDNIQIALTEATKKFDSITKKQLKDNYNKISKIKEYITAIK